VNPPLYLSKHHEKGDECLAMASYLLDVVKTISLWTMPKEQRKEIYLDKVTRARDELNRLLELIQSW
jgi:hypothetical protein